MEQPNMMPGGMPNPQMNNSMQRPQPGNMAQQVHAKVLDELRRAQPSLGAGWQAMLDIRERAQRIMQLITNLRHINGDMAKCYSIAITWENKVITSSANKEQYLQQMQAKLNEITAKRQQVATQMNMPGNMGMMPNNMMNMQNGMMNAPNMQNNGMGNMNFPNGGNMGMQGGHMQQGQNPMAQLQRQMQASPLPMQQQPQQPGTLDPSALQMPQGNQQQQSQQPPSQQGQSMGQSNQPQQLNMPQGGPGKPNHGIPPEIMQIAKQMSDRMAPEQKNELRGKLTANMSDAQKAQLQQQNMDPLARFFMARAQTEYAKRRQQQMGMGGALPNQPGMGNGNNMNMAMGNNVPQRPPSQTSGQNIDFSSIMGQQANALKLQDAGEQVVPASNNNNGNNNGNNTTMPQNINPQMLGNNNNQGQQGGNGQTSQQQMQMIMMQRAHAERLNKQMMAQQHAMASRQQHSQLQGQPGGLHTPNGFGAGANGQVNSPAMSMLNRPMAPPGQTTPGTPQPNRQQPMPSTPMNNGVSQLQQHHQSMLNQNNQQQQMTQATQNNGPATSLQDLLQRVPPSIRDRLSQMPQDQARIFIQRFQNQLGRHQGQMGMPNGMPNGMNMGLPPQGFQQQNGMQPNMGNAIPGFNAQPPPNQMNMDPAAHLQQRMQRDQQFKLRTQAMDMRPFPKPVLTQLGIAVPQNVQLWGHLKQHVLQNSPQGTIDKVSSQQQLWFQNHPEEFQAAMAAMMAKVRMSSGAQPGPQGPPGQVQPQSQQNGAAQPPASMAERPAPTAQMVPPAPMMQPPNQGMQPGANQGPRPMPNMPHISPQELAHFRSKVPAANGMADDQLRNYLVRQKIEKMRQQQQMQRQSLQTAQMQKPPGQVGVQPNAANMGLPQQQRTPQPPAAQQSATGQPKAQSQSNNDVVEISSQAVAQTAPQAPPMQASQSQNQAQQAQPPVKQLSQQQLQQLSEKDRQAYLLQMQQLAQKESIRKAQGQVGAANRQTVPPGQQPGSQRMQPSPAIVEKVRSLQQEVAREFKRGNPVQVDAQTMERCKAMLKKLYQPLHQIGSTFGAALNLGFDEGNLKSLMRAMLTLQSNAVDASGNIKDYLSVTLAELQDIERLVAGYMTELKRKKQANDNARMQVAGMQPQGVKPQQGAPAANMARTGSQQNHTRKPSASNRAPPAPTDNKSFDWAAPSPHGVPKYQDGRNELTPDKLKFPPQKKRKTDQPGSQASTPAAQAGTPAAGTGASPALQTGKVQSPEHMRKTPAQIRAEAEKAAEQKKFPCTDITCEASLRGFETEEQLKQHQDAQHKPVDDPLQFLLGSMATALDVGQDGKPLQKTQAPAPKTKTKPAAKGKEDQKKQQQGTEAKDVAPKCVTLSEAMSKKLDLPVAPEATAESVSKEEDFLGPFISPEDMEEIGTFPFALSQLYDDGYVEDPDHLGVFNLRPGALDHDSSPDLTPSEGSQTSQNSDVSQNDAVNFNIWLENMDTDMLGNGSQGVPEGILPLFEQMENISMMKEGEDTQMSNTEDSKGESDASKKRKVPEMWQPPVADFMQSFYNGAN